MITKPKLLIAGFATILGSLSVASWAVTPPKYLEIKQFDQCLVSQPNASYQAWCMPAQKPKACAQASWTALKKLTGQDKVPACEAK